MEWYDMCNNVWNEFSIYVKSSRLHNVKLDMHHVDVPMIPSIQMGANTNLRSTQSVVEEI